MRLVFTSYASAPSYTDPMQWLQRIEGYTGILESLAATHEVISIERTGYEGEISHKGVRYYFLRQKVKTKLFPFRIHRLVRRLRPDAVFINGFIFPFQLLQLRASIGPKIPVLIINRSEKPGTGYRKWLQRAADRLVSAYLFPSLEAGMQWVEKGIIKHEHKLYEVFHGSSVFTAGDKTEAREKLDIQAPLVCLWVGRLNANKDPLTALRAFQLFCRERKGALLCMIYQENDLLQEITTFIAENNLAASVKLIGPVPHRELETWYRAADFFITASHYEGGGIALCEAMSCGAIPVVTAIDSFRVLTGNGACGFLFNAGDPLSMLDALQRAAGSNIPEWREKVLSKYRKDFSFDAIARSIDQLLIRIKTTA